MGLFDFLKSPEERKQEEMMQKMHQQIFPGGLAQIEKEISEVRALFDFKYTKDDVKSTYNQAVAIYFLAKDKSPERIISSILHNHASVLTKADAIKLYQYLQVKFNPTAVLSNIISESDALKLFLIAKGGVVELQKEYKNLSDKGKYEALIFNSLLALRFFNEKYPDIYNEEMEGEYHLFLFEQANSYRINLSPEQLMNFINSRFDFYSDEIDNIYEGDGYIPNKLFSTFYLNPLISNPVESNDMEETILFFQGLANAMRWLHVNISRLKI